VIQLIQSDTHSRVDQGFKDSASGRCYHRTSAKELNMCRDCFVPRNDVAGMSTSPALAIAADTGRCLRPRRRMSG